MAEPIKLRSAFNLKLADAKGKQADARLIFRDDNKHVAVQVADRDSVTVPYGQLDKFSYEYTKKHRILASYANSNVSSGCGSVNQSCPNSKCTIRCPEE